MSRAGRTANIEYVKLGLAFFPLQLHSMQTYIQVLGFTPYKYKDMHSDEHPAVDSRKHLHALRPSVFRLNKSSQLSMLPKDIAIELVALESAVLSVTDLKGRGGLTASVKDEVVVVQVKGETFQLGGLINFP